MQCEVNRTLVVKKKFFFLLVMISTLSVSAVERVSLDSLRANWSRYINQTVEITTPLVVCGNYYDSLILAPERIFCPEERAVGLADGDSTVYHQIAAHNRETTVCLHCRNSYYNTRTGDIVRRLRARVTGERQLLTGKSIRTRHITPKPLPKRKRGELRVVGANIENYFADLGGYATRRTTPEQQAMKTRKLVKAMRRMKADIFALCEMQMGDRAPQMLLAELNRGAERYDYVRTAWPDKDQIAGCFIYRKDRVRPTGEWLSAYQDTAGHYRPRMITQAFETLDNKGKPDGRKMIISLNHFKSKSTRRRQYDTNVKRMENADSLLAMLPVAAEMMEDPDILLLGDYNCYTQEQPIQTIVRAGYTDLLQVFCPTGYSYTYHSETGYLDRCFATPAMAEQVVRVTPWHVNADWYYSHGAYKLRDKSHHRYADHDPIIVDIKLR